MDTKINIRKGTRADFGALGAVTHTAIHSGASAYTPEQRAAWSPHVRAASEMEDRLGGQTIFLGETGAGAIAGFLTLANEGYVDFAYILTEHQGKGLFRRLYEQLELEARAAWITRLHTHASFHARPAFAAMGFRTIVPETVQANGVWLPRFKMDKRL